MFCKLLHPCYCFIYWGIPNNLLLFSAEQISLIPFYIVEDTYHKNQLGARLYIIYLYNWWNPNEIKSNVKTLLYMTPFHNRPWQIQFSMVYIHVLLFYIILYVKVLPHKNIWMCWLSKKYLTYISRLLINHFGS